MKLNFRLFTCLLLVLFLSGISSAFILFKNQVNWQSVSSFKTFLDLCLIDNQVIDELNELVKPDRYTKILVLPLTNPLSTKEVAILSTFLDSGGTIISFPVKGQYEEKQLKELLFTSFPNVSTELFLDNSSSYTKLNTSIYFFDHDITTSIREDNTKEILIKIIKESHPNSLLKANEFVSIRVDEILSIVEKTLDQSQQPNKSLAQELAQKLSSLANRALDIKNTQSLHLWTLTTLKKEAEELAELYRSTYFDSLPVETRGIWISTKALPKTEEGIASLVKEVAQAGINLILPEVFAYGYTIFPSLVAEKYGIETQNPNFINSNPLAILVKEASKYNIEVHAWFTVFYVGLNNHGPILSKYPDWIARNEDGSVGYSRDGNYLYFVSPLSIEFREYVTDLMAETVGYGVDGIHLDYIRYSGMDVPETDYSENAVTSFFERYGLKPNEARTQASKLWIYHRSKGVDDLVEMAYLKTKKQAPNIFLSAAVAPDGPPSDYRRNYLQNWPLWLTHGYIDFVIPMTYSPNPSNVTNWFRSAVNKAPKYKPVYAGISGFNLYERLTLNKQVSELGRSSGSLGSFFFAYDHFDSQSFKVLRAGVFSLDASPAHHYRKVDLNKLTEYIIDRIYKLQNSKELQNESSQILERAYINIVDLLNQDSDNNSFQYSNYKESLIKLEQISDLLKSDAYKSCYNILKNDFELLESWLYEAGHHGLIASQEVYEVINKITREIEALLPGSIYALIPKYLVETKSFDRTFIIEINNLIELFKFDKNNRNNHQLQSLLEELAFAATLVAKPYNLSL